MRFRLLLSIIILCVSTSAFSQFYGKEKGYGGGAIYNLPIKNIGFEARMHYHLSDFFILSPQVEYFPFGAINEINGGINLLFDVNPLNNLGFYATIGGHANYWMNSDASPNPDAKPFNIYPDAGVGTMWNYNCLRPFIEYRINFKWMESSIRGGIMWYPFACGDPIKCPTYYK